MLTQLGLLECFHHTLKQEEVYWRLYNDPGYVRACLAEFRNHYNRQRSYWALIAAWFREHSVQLSAPVDSEITRVEVSRGGPRR